MKSHYIPSETIFWSHRLAKLVCLLQLFMPIDVANLHNTPGQHVAEFLPPQMLHKVLIIPKSIIEAIPLRSHDEDRILLGICIMGVALCHCK